MNDTQNQSENQQDEIVHNKAMENEDQISEQEQAERDEYAARMESIRQLAQSGELEVLPEQAEIVDALNDTVQQRDQLQDQLLRTAADHQNFQRRASINEREARTGATQGVVQSLIPLLDTFEMALLQDPEKVSAEQVIEGVKMIRDEFVRMLSGYGVRAIDPQVGDEFNPVEHAAMMQLEGDGIEPGHISQNMGIGYKLGERVVRPAKVAVVPAKEESDAATEE
ncbi:MAG: nucleotide exchange factor GrpE [Phycisphaerales bacterium]